MRRSAYRSLAAISLLLSVVPLEAARRPRYGGTLRVETAEKGTDAFIAKLVLERLVEPDETGRLQPSLAAWWKTNARATRWEFRIRSGVKFHDGSALTPASVAAALNGELQATAIGDSVVIQCDRPRPELLAELADVRRSISLRGADGSLVGTGPFRVVQFEPGRRVLVAANDQYWGGRPFLDAVSIEMGRSPTDQLLDVEVGKADLVEIAIGDVRRAADRHVKLWSSAPAILMALVFDRARPAVEDPRLRQAIALAIDRRAIHNVLLQRQGEVAGGLLPQWLSGYAFLFPTEPDIAQARQLTVGRPSSAQPLILAYDPSNPLAHAVADRIVLNVREAGIRMQTSNQPGKADLSLATLRIESATPDRALAALTGQPRFPNPPSLDALYQAERAVVDDFHIVPLFHLPAVYGSSPSVKTWNTPGILKTGGWRFDDLWLASERP